MNFRVINNGRRRVIDNIRRRKPCWKLKKKEIDTSNILSVYWNLHHLF
jgi:hypothetical protein